MGTPVPLQEADFEIHRAEPVYEEPVYEEPVYEEPEVHEEQGVEPEEEMPYEEPQDNYVTELHRDYGAPQEIYPEAEPDYDPHPAQSVTVYKSDATVV